MNDEGTSTSGGWSEGTAPGGHAEPIPRLRLFRADLHIHTALSPCGSDEMTPAAIVATAVARGLDMIAVCDHNTAGNARAVQQAGEAAGGGLAIIAGMELTSMEEVHVVGLFPDAAHAEQVAAQVRDVLPRADADYYSFFGGQPVLAADGRQMGAETAALALATPFDLNEAVALIHDGGGLAVAAHIDRKSFGVFSQLGFFPTDAGFDALEISKWLPADSTRWAEFAALGLPLLGCSDAHYAEEIGTACTEFMLEEPTFAELALAFAGAGGRTTARTAGGDSPLGGSPSGVAPFGAEGRGAGSPGGRHA